MKIHDRFGMWMALVQRFEALEPLDREAIRSGAPRVGMSTEALRFVWGGPYYTEGDARRSARWHYLGSSFGRSGFDNPRWDFSQRVEVYLVNGKVVGWVDVAPTTPESSSDGGRSAGG
jgi:outer membrane protein assembly factor BamE (lipoprotein component of BamABCDE complex)